MKHLEIAEQALWLSIDKVVPNPKQARKNFDYADLVLLSKSIKSEGQHVAIEVRFINGEYQIIHGERRWRACKIAKLNFIKGIIKEGICDAAAYRRSAVANFGKADHTILEAMDIISREIEEKKNDPKRPEEKKTMEIIIQEIADSFAQNTNWVYLRLRLFDLHKDILKFLNPKLPKEKRLNFSQALAIAKYPDKLKQLEVAAKTVKEKLTANEVEHHFRKIAAKSGVQYGERKRRPSDDRAVMESFLNKVLHKVQQYHDSFKGNGSLEKMFATCAPGERKKMRLLIKSCEEHFGELSDVFS